MSDGQGNEEQVENILNEGEAGEQPENVEGMEPDASPQEDESGSQQEAVEPVGVQKRLKRKEREHQRQMRQMQEQMAALQEQIGSSQQGGNAQGNDQEAGQASPDDQIEQAVRRALSHKEEQERQQQQAEHQQVINQEYQDLRKRLDEAADKYDDFDEVVEADHQPYTEAMRDTALLLPNAPDVLYELGKKPDELKRISKLHPLKQSKELVNLAFALAKGGGDKKASVPESMSQIKTTMGSPKGKESVSEIRKRLKGG